VSKQYREWYKEKDNIQGMIARGLPIKEISAHYKVCSTTMSMVIDKLDIPRLETSRTTKAEEWAWWNKILNKARELAGLPSVSASLNPYIK